MKYLPHFIILLTIVGCTPLLSTVIDCQEIPVPPPPRPIPQPPGFVPPPYDVGVDSPGMTYDSFQRQLEAGVEARTVHRPAGWTSPEGIRYIQGARPGIWVSDGPTGRPIFPDGRDIRTHVQRIFPDGRVYVDEAGNVKVKTVTKTVNGRPMIAVKGGAGTGLWFDLAIIIGICVWDIWTDDPWDRAESFGYPPEWDVDTDDIGFSLDQLQKLGVLGDDTPETVTYDRDRPIPWNVPGVSIMDVMGGGGDSAPPGVEMAAFNASSLLDKTADYFLPGTGPFDNLTSSLPTRMLSAARRDDIFCTVGTSTYPHQPRVCWSLGGYPIDSMGIIDVNGTKIHTVTILGIQTGWMAAWITDSGIELDSIQNRDDLIRPDNAKGAVTYWFVDNSMDGMHRKANETINRLRSLAAVQDNTGYNDLPNAFIEKWELTEDEVTMRINSSAMGTGTQIRTVEWFGDRVEQIRTNTTLARHMTYNTTADKLVLYLGNPSDKIYIDRI